MRGLHKRESHFAFLIHLSNFLFTNHIKDVSVIMTNVLKFGQKC